MISIIAGILGVVELAAQSSLLTIATLAAMFPLGFAEAIMSTIGNSIGANNVSLAKKFFKVVFFISVILFSFICIGLVSFRSAIASIMTNDEEVHDMIASVLIIQGCLALTHLFQLFLQGPIKALGRQNVASVISVICNYVLGIPCCLLLAFKMEMGLKGLAIGIGVAQTSMTICFLALILLSDWQGITDEA